MVSQFFSDAPPSRQATFSYISRLPGYDNKDLPPAFQGNRSLVILGSTGSIGCSALRVIETSEKAGKGKRFQIVGLAGGKNLKLLAEQATAFLPPYLAIQQEEDVEKLRALLPAGYSPQIFVGPSGYANMAALQEASFVLSAQVGAAGLRGTVAAALAGKVICLANKESLVLAGDLLRLLCAQTGAVILPVDSEHNAILNCLLGRPWPHWDGVKSLVLTASGGPFHARVKKEGPSFLAHVTAKDALRHPNWSMGAKITIDSATLMNKGFECIEACHLYGARPSDVRVFVHPESLVHSFVEFVDGSLLAQVSKPDMRGPIASCLAWPEILDSEQSGLSLLDLVGKSLHFEEADPVFCCLPLALAAFAENTAMPVVLNAANEVAVARFLAGEIGFLDIPLLVGLAMEDIRPQAQAKARLVEQYGASAAKPDKAFAESIVSGIEKLDAVTRDFALHWEKP